MRLREAISGQVVVREGKIGGEFSFDYEAETLPSSFRINNISI